MNPIGLTLPLQIGRNGYFEQSYDTLTQVKANITNLLRTKKGERRMNPNFGSGLQEYLFEQNLQDSPDIVKQIITDEITNYVPGVTVNKVDNGISNQEKNELTVSWWVKLNGTLSRPGCGQSTLDVDAMETNVWLMHGGETNQFTFYVNDSGSWRSIDSSVLTVGAWYNLVGTINTTNISIYVNGTSYATGAGISTGITNNSNSIMTIGIDPRYLTLSQFFNGSVATKMVYNRSLSSSEILQNYNIQKSRFGL